MMAGVSVVIDDDEADARELIRRILEELACQVETAAAAEEGVLQLLREKTFDIILSGHRDAGHGRGTYAFLAVLAKDQRRNLAARRRRPLHLPRMSEPKTGSKARCWPAINRTSPSP